MASFAFNVWLNNRLIDTIFMTVGKKETIADAIESTRLSLINHDGYDSGIKVTWPKGQRLTEDSYDLMGDYGQGWELLCSGTTRREARDNMKDYQQNAPCPMKIIKRRERV